MKKVYSYYVMDILHDGHIEMLRNCRAVADKLGGILIVGILTDEAVMEKKPRPIMSFGQRYRLARSLDMIDVVVAQETYSPLHNVAQLKVDILMESGSHTRRALEDAREVMRIGGGDVVVIPYYPLESSTGIKNRIRKDTHEEPVVG